MAPNGARRTKDDHPGLPITTEEIAVAAKASWQAGASGIHVHIRDAFGAHSLDPETYQDTINAIQKSAPELEIQLTTESGGIYSVQQQFDCLVAVQPERASIAIREMCRDTLAARRVYAFTRDAGIDVQHIIYDVQDFEHLGRWMKSGEIQTGSLDFLFVLGRYDDTKGSNPASIQTFLNNAPDVPFTWSVCAFGPQEHACLLHAANLGAPKLRVGFENSLVNAANVLWSDNAASVDALIAALRRK